MTREGGSDGGSVLLIGGLVVAAAFVFVVLPRWSAAPVVTTTPPPRPAPQTTIALAPAPEPLAPRPSRRTQPDPPAPAVPDEWNAAVSAGLAALDRGSFAEAHDAFTHADALRPGTATVADGLARAEAGRVGDELRVLQAKGQAAESREAWREALAGYEAALKLAPAVSFAVQGRARAAVRAALDDRLQRYLDRPERLSAEAVAREAATTLAEAADVEDAGPRLGAQRAALERLLAGAAQPVAVALRSDGVTQVTILRVGALGAFKEKTLTLRPGAYVVSGARPGYRDVRRTLVVPVGRSPEPFGVRCDEAL